MIILINKYIVVVKMTVSYRRDIVECGIIIYYDLSNYKFAFVY